MKVNMINKDTNQIKIVKLGYSWTTLLFGCFPALFRGDWKWFFIILIANMVTVNISTIVFSFLYNKIYINDLLEKGFQPADDVAKNALISKGILAHTN